MRQLICIIVFIFSTIIPNCSCGQDNSIILLPPIDPPIECKTSEDCLKHTDGCFTSSCLIGECHYGYFINDTPCDDKNPCTAHGKCFKGNCIGGEFRECDPPDQCHEDGLCDTVTGECLYFKKANYVLCDDSNPGTLIDQCHNGKCTGITTNESY